MLRWRAIGTRSLGWFGLLFLLAFGAASCSRSHDNAAVTSDVQNRLRSDVRMQMARVQVVATNGAVTLSGYVVSPEQRLETVKDASQAHGVRVVIDNLRVIGATSPDSNHLDTTVQRAVPETRKPSALIPRFPRPSTSPQSRVIPEAGDSRPSPASVPDRPVATQTTGARSEPVTAISHAISPTTPVVSTANVVDHKTVPNRNSLPGTVSPVSFPVASTPAASIPEPEQVTVPNGTELVVRLTESLSSDVNEKGDTFLASLSSPIMIEDRVVVPAEAGVEGKVIEVQSAGRFSGRPKLAIEMTRLTYNGKTYELRSTQYAKQGASRDTRSLAAIGGGAGAGAIIGAVLGGGRGAAIGSIIGAGVGTGAQATSKPSQIKLPAETVLSVRLQGPLTVEPASSLRNTHPAGSGSAQDPFSTDADRPVLKRRPGSPPPETDEPAATAHFGNQ
jgi:hypothetical protein